jgi:hypothetical protein
VLDAHRVRFEHADLPVIVQSEMAGRVLDSHAVEQGHMGVLFEDGKYVETLPSGRYAFWKNVAKVALVPVDMRETMLDVAGQEIMTADKVTLRMNAVITYRVANAKVAVSVRQDIIRLYDVRSGEQVGDIPEGRKGDAIIFSPDGSKLVFGHWEESLHVWDVRRRKEVRTFKSHTDYITSLAFSPDNRLLASASSSHGKPWPPRREDRSIRLWDFQKGKEVARFSGDWDTTTYLAFLPGSKNLVSFHDPDSDPTVWLWSPSTAEALAVWERGAGVQSVAVSLDGECIATGDQWGRIRLWALASVLPSSHVVQNGRHRLTPSANGSINHRQNKKVAKAVR